jgi:hypothetical protein
MQGDNRGTGRPLPPVETRFKKGQSGNPAGRPKSALYSDALRRKLSQIDETDEHEPKRSYAEILAEKAILKAKEGDIQALAHVADRTEGKPRQTLLLTLEQREKFETAISGIMAETKCSREEAIATLSLFKPEVSELLN